MENPTAKTRKANLKRFVDVHLGGRRAELARICDPENPKPSYFSDLLNSPKKAFGEKAARRIEGAVGLEFGQLDVVDSPLKLSKPVRRTNDIASTVSALNAQEKAEVMDFLEFLLEKRKKRA